MAVRHELILSNPFTGAVVPRIQKIGDDRPKVLTAAQLRAFLKAVPGEWSLFFETLMSTGARWSEAVAWKRRDLNVSAGRLTVERTLYEGEYMPTKSDYSRREIPLSPALARRLSPCP